MSVYGMLSCCLAAVAVMLGAGTALLNLTSGAPAPSPVASVPHVLASRPFAAPPTAKPQPAATQSSNSAPPPAKPQPITGQSSGSAPQPAPLPTFTQQPQSILSFQPRQPSQADSRPAFGQPTSQPSFGNQAFSLTKQKDSVDPSKQSPTFPSIPSSKTFPPPFTASGHPPAENVRPAASNHPSAGTSFAPSFSSLSSQSFNFGPPMGQSTPAPAANRMASQVRVDTHLPGSESATVKTVPTATGPAAVAKSSAAVMGHRTAGDQTIFHFF